LTVPVFFIREEAIKGDKAVLSDPEDIHHALRVLRIRQGERLVLYDGAGMEYKAILERVESEGIICGIVGKERVGWRPAPLSILIGILKGDKNELVVQKATELGVKEIILTPMRRSMPRLHEEGMVGKEKRLRKVSLEACRQCMRPIPPSVKVCRWEEALNAIKGSDLILVPWEEEKEKGIWELIREREWRNCAVVVGPEGGFELEEIKDLKAVGGIPVSLGTLRKRSETAAIFCLSALTCELASRGLLI